MVAMKIITMTMITMTTTMITMTNIIIYRRTRSKQWELWRNKSPNLCTPSPSQNQVRTRSLESKIITLKQFLTKRIWKTNCVGLFWTHSLTMVLKRKLYISTKIISKKIIQQEHSSISRRLRISQGPPSMGWCQHIFWSKIFPKTVSSENRIERGGAFLWSSNEHG